MFELETLSKPAIIHVAGTKGKGTTCYYCNHIISEYQKRRGQRETIGCYTSPHQVEVRERIQINSKPISKILFARYFQRLWSEVQSLKSDPTCKTPPIPGYPGFLTLLAIYVFIQEKINVAIIETGIGGETDSTNVFRHPVAVGITTLGLDHTHILGNTIEDIAWHKAGIFKRGCTAFTVVQQEAAMNVLHERAKEIGVSEDLNIVTDEIVRSYGLTVNPNMYFQRLNASLAISLATTYLASIDPDFSMSKDLTRCLERTLLPGRCQIKADADNIWLLSVAHNSLSLQETVAWFKEVVQMPEYNHVNYFRKPLTSTQAYQC
jgi:folylpolyglutamate synthase